MLSWQSQAMISYAMTEQQNLVKMVGGVLIYYKDSHTVIPLEHGSHCCKSLETCWIRLVLLNSRDTYIGSIYRAPDSNINESISALNDHLENMNVPINSDIVMMGDFNVDLSRNKPDARQLRNSLLLKNDEQLIESHADHL